MLRHVRELHTKGPRKKYTCTNSSCNRQYARLDILKNHSCRGRKTPNQRKRCDSKGPKNMYCDKCKNIFRDPFRFVMHINQNCPKLLIYECDMCSKLVPGRVALTRHFANDHKLGTATKCRECDKRFTCRRSLEFHRQSHAWKIIIPQDSQKPSTTYECDYCKRLFRLKTSRTLHMKKFCHLRTHFEKNLTNDAQRFDCELCGQAFMQKVAINDHMRIMHSTISFSVKNFTKNFSCSMNQTILRIFQCCDKKYFGNTLNQKHVTTERCRYFCKGCKIYFADYYSLLRHCSEHSFRVRQCLRHLHECKRCNKLFEFDSFIPEYLKPYSIISKF